MNHSRLKILTVFGTRPEAVKLAPVVQEIANRPDELEGLICVTAQHREMLDQVLDVFDIHPNYDLNIMTHGQSLVDVTSRVLYGMTEILQKVQPDLVIVQGDTTTVFTTALSAFYQQIGVGHVEAGLRTGDIYSPFPEEINRRLTGPMTTFHFAPTRGAAENLMAESVQENRIAVTGNTVIDALLQVAERPYHFSDPRLDDLEKVILITAHRRESFGDPIRRVCKAILRLSDQFPEYTFVYPVHPNPNILTVANELLQDKSNVLLIEPLSYEPFIHLMKKSTVILSDSGGVQEEAPSLDKPVLVLRDVTERPEVLIAGAAKLVGTDDEVIVRETTRLLTDSEAYDKAASAINPFGDGKAAVRIVNFIIENRDVLRPCQ